MVDKDGMIVEKGHASFMYADDVCLITSIEQDMHRIFDSINGCISEYDVKVSGTSMYKWS